jgi:multidrug efflux system membrane fusion protein
VVPVTALRHGPNGDFVYVLKDDRTVELRPVTRGEASVDTVAVSKGLESGEQVVTEGGDRLKDGAKVQTAADRPASGASGGASGARGNRGARAGFGASGASGASGFNGASGAASGGHRRDRGASGASAQSGASTTAQ